MGSQAVQPVRWGVVSTAQIARDKVVPAMMKSEWCDIRAIASRSLDNAREWAGKLGIPTAYGSYEGLFADPEIEAIYNPLPNHLHVPITLAAAAKGKHVLCEKPIALNAVEAERLRSAPPGVLIAEGFMVRQHPQWIRARELIRAGRIGAPHCVQVLLCYHNVEPGNVRNVAEAGGGALYDVGCYAILSGRYVFGAEPTRVVSLIDRDPNFGTDRLTSVLLDFGEGRHQTFTVGTQICASQRVQIVGTEARIEIEVPYAAPRGAMRIYLDDSRDLDELRLSPIVLPEADQYELQGTHFSKVVRGEAKLEFGVDDAIRQMRVIDAVFRSERSGTWEGL